GRAIVEDRVEHDRIDPNLQLLAELERAAGLADVPRSQVAGVDAVAAGDRAPALAAHDDVLDDLARWRVAACVDPQRFGLARVRLLGGRELVPLAQRVGIDVVAQRQLFDALAWDDLVPDPARQLAGLVRGCSPVGQERSDGFSGRLERTVDDGKLDHRNAAKLGLNG